MFQKARIRLTAWYLVIIMSISFLFSIVIYTGFDRELTRFERFQGLRQQERETLAPTLEQFRQEREKLGLPVPSIPRGFSAPDPEIISEARTRIITILVLANFGILTFSSFAGYFLAGKTLRPIKEMVDEQNRFITDASHELRTPLTALKSETEVTLRSKDLTFKEAKNQLASNLEEIDKLQVLSDSLIKLTAYQKTNNNSKFVKTSIFQISSDAIKKVSPLAKQKGIRIENNIKNISIEVERNTFGELFVILLDNAIKHNLKGTLVTLSAKKTDGQVEVLVKDNGMGIEKIDRPHLFDRFYRVEKSRTKDHVVGYGLGLAIAKEIIEKHNGSIKVESETGKGTTFVIQFPIKR